MVSTFPSITLTVLEAPKLLLDAVTVDGADLFTVTKSADGTRWNITVNKKADNTDYTDSDGAKIAAALNTDSIKAAAVATNSFAYDRDTGDAVQQYRLMVKIVFYVRSAKEMCLILQQLNRTIEITDTDGRDMIVRFNDYETVMQRHKGLMQTEAVP